MVPRTVGPWEILSVIGRGGIGVVYRARHRPSGRLAAVKLLGPAPLVDPRAARRLAREFEVLRALDHPNVVRVFEAGVYEGYSYLAMELVEGLDLRTFLSPALDEAAGVLSGSADPSLFSASAGATPPEVGPDAIRTLAAMMDEPETAPAEFHPPVPAAPGAGAPPLPRPPLEPGLQAALNRPHRLERLDHALAQVLEALDYVHRHGLVHRDLKPSNIMVDDQRQARIMDFGLVKHPEEAAEPLTGTGRVVGTYRYMSPEQAQGLPVDGRSDLYSLGVILYELLAAAPPFTAQLPAELWHQILHQPPQPLAEINPGVDPDLAAVAERCLAKSPDARFGSAREILDVLRR
ncbi:MAG TPA: serine/threonine-protein kinase [Anaeromyxobacteraceae bacterium]|nr:serine/threonine-protein kinase [Anaeromyxobacteraceae bacterium]